jgi:hypothetical protein
MDSSGDLDIKNRISNEMRVVRIARLAWDGVASL